MTKLFFYLSVIAAIFSCNAPAENSETETPIISRPILLGEKVYNENCKLCHGKDGSLGLTGATNLKLSQLTKDQRIEVIVKGRNGMASFKGIIDDEQIQAVAEYLESLKDIP